MKAGTVDEADDWTAEGANFAAPATMDVVRRAIEAGPIIVEHWFYRAARGPSRQVFDDFDHFADYLKANARAGDSIHVWSFSAVCGNHNELVRGKYPDDRGRVPNRGAY